MGCGGFGNAPQTGEAEGLLTSPGNVTHFSKASSLGLVEQMLHR